jgi:hypothetical protein
MEKGKNGDEKLGQQKEEIGTKLERHWHWPSWQYIPDWQSVF